MSWDFGCQTMIIKSNKENYGKILEMIKTKDKQLKNAYSKNEGFCGKGFAIEFNGENITITEYGVTKYGSFRSINEYNQDEFIYDIIMVDKENTVVQVANDNYMSDDTLEYFYENGSISYIWLKQKHFNSLSKKEEILKNIREDVHYFFMLNEEERKDYDYQFASLDQEWPSDLWEFLDCYDHYYTQAFLDNEEVVKLLFKYGHRSLVENRLSDKVKNNEKLMIECIKLHPSYLCDLPLKYRDNKELILELLKLGKVGFSLSDLSKRLRNDKKVVLNILKYNSHDIADASERLRDDKEVVMFAIKNGAGLGRYGYGPEHMVSERLRKDKEVCIAALKTKYSDVLKLIENEEVLNDHDLMLEQVKDSYFNLQYIGDLLKSKDEFLITYAESFNKYNDNSYSKEKSLDLGLLVKMTTIEKIKYLYKNAKYFNCNYISNEYRNDIKLLNELDEIKGDKYDSPYEHLGDKLENDEELILDLMSKKKSVNIGETLLNNKSFLIEAAKYANEEFYLSIYKLGSDMKYDDEIINLYLEINPNQIIDLPKEKITIELVKRLLPKITISEIICHIFNLDYDKSSPWVSNAYTNLPHLELSKDLALMILENHEQLFKVFPENIRYDYDVTKKAVSKDGFALDFSNPENRNNKELILLALDNSYSSNWSGSKDLNISKDLLNDIDIYTKLLNNSYHNMKFLSNEVRTNKETYINISKNEANKNKNINFLEYAPDYLISDYNFMMEIFRNLGIKIEGNNLKEIYQYYYDNIDTLFMPKIFPNCLRNDIDFVKFILKKESILYKKDNLPEIKNVKELMKWLISSNRMRYNVYKLTPEELYNDREFMLFALKNNCYCTDEHAIEIWQNDSELKQYFKKEDQINLYDTDDENNDDNEKNEEDYTNDSDYDDSDVTEEDFKIIEKDTYEDMDLPF